MLNFNVCFFFSNKKTYLSSFQSYIPPLFVEPKIPGSPYLIDWFADPNAIGKKWILSKGKKDDTEDSIAKYNGRSFFIFLHLMQLMYHEQLFCELN